MHITRLRLVGFKSFVEPTELLIEQGLTGVVGPNGCGKSNLLEALRWVMGETSHKSMRAASMDDVIFSGTSTRPERGSAEVTIFLDNKDRKAPAEWNDAEAIEITRRIEREAGSAYRINGREARARDVKILFEDAATGARSPALVRQGQISELVNAKPEQRRRVLEDAAGIAGLHSRRHEAELRLKAAETNLVRVGDVIGQVQSQMEGLKRQARQAKRYKEISADIRRAEAMLLHLAWSESQAQVEAEEAALALALAKVAQCTQAETTAIAEEAAVAETVQPLREGEAERAAALARIAHEQEAFEREAERLAARQKELVARAGQLERDLVREDGLIEEAKELLERLAEEGVTLAEQDAEAGIVEEAAREKLDEVEAHLKGAETRLGEATRLAFETRARRKSLEAAAGERRQDLDKIKRQLQALEVQAREVALRAPDAGKLRQVSEAGQKLLAEVGDIEMQAIAAEDKAMEAAAEAKARREASAAAQLKAGQARTELDTLSKLLGPVKTEGIPGIVDQLRVAPGYEMALGAALGEDLDAPTVVEHPVHWRRVGMGEGDPALPADVEPLIGKVEGPPELVRRLRQIGVVSADEGAVLQPELKPGQRLVSLEGDLWRWDGYVSTANAPTAAAIRLAERNRLGDIEVRETALRREAEDLASADRTAAEMLRIAQEEERRLRQAWRDAQAELAKTRESLSTIERQARETETRLAAIAEQRASLGDQIQDVTERLAEAEAALELLAGDDSAEVALTSAERDTQVARVTAGEAKMRLNGLERDRQTRSDRAKVLEVERQRWMTRISGATTQKEALAQRLAEAKADLGQLEDLPAMVAGRRQELMDARGEAEALRTAASDKLAAAELGLRKAAQALRDAQTAFTATREALARTETRLETSRGRRTEEARRIREILGVMPEGCLAIAERPADAALPSLADAETSLNRLKADRERLGGVNLQAEEELGELTQQFDQMEGERVDLEAAIAKLRGGIGQLNAEGRRRLQAAFETVNGHFQRLFGILFGGGEARLEMIESPEDPLEGGLEIIAKPPGKKPATLSLLSGGEQTLTALSLIFAVFLTNPSPICVLDEVDAPLDDANVDRFCTMMERMASETATRFLVITHHPMTMSRMNRLFGVTMAEKGVSQLVSVDLETARRVVNEDAHVA